ncbi:MAG: glycine oxidase ThiO [Betaproteobacteria bacterium]|nr:glycine oxidase ThiO [Betaproteobacteria bacterium]
MTERAVVVGAGVSGLSVALALLRRGERVTVLERGETGGESSWAGGGILSPLLPWDYPEPVASLALHSMAMYADWVAEIEALSGVDAEFWRCGMLASEVAVPDQALAWCAEHGMAAMRSCPLRLPAPLDAYKENQLWLPDIAQVRNPRLVASLRAAVLRLGGEVHEHCLATGVQTRQARVTEVRTDAGDFPADNVILAAGAWGGLSLTGIVPVPNIRPIRGQMLLFKPAAGVLDTILYRNGLYLIPRRDGHILVGSTLEDAGFDKTTDDATRQRLHGEAAELLPALAGLEPVRHWAGLRPGSPGNVPVIDRHPDFDNVFVNAGHYRYGVTMAPASAALLVDLMEGNTSALDPAPYRWEAALARHWGGAL